MHKTPTRVSPQVDCDGALGKLQLNMDMGAVVIVPVDWSEVHQIAEKLSANHTRTRGQRAFDLLHIATALHLDARDFLSFDDRQRELAKKEGLKVKP